MPSFERFDGYGEVGGSLWEEIGEGEKEEGGRESKAGNDATCVAQGRAERASAGGTNGRVLPEGTYGSFPEWTRRVSRLRRCLETGIVSTAYNYASSSSLK